MAADPFNPRGLGEAKLEALIEMMYLAASADGELGTEERAHFAKSVESLTDGRVGAPELERILERAAAALSSSSREQRLKAVKSRLPEPGARKAALTAAIRVTAADGIIRTSERELILETAEALEIDRDEAADLVKALSS